MYDKSSQEQLKEKLGYELWLLSYLTNTEKTIGGEANIPVATFTNRENNFHEKIEISEILGAGSAKKIINLIAPLTFTACYKILDMIFEWVLEENHLAERIHNKKIPSQWRFSEKIKQIPMLNLVYPPAFEAQLFLKSYLFALYKNLLEIRNEIVHRNNFSVSSNGKISVTIPKEKNTLELDSRELNALAKILVTLANILSGNSSLGQFENKHIKYNLDLIQQIHRLDTFNQQKPRLLNVKLKVPREKNGLFLADLKFIRGKLSQSYPGADILFNLEITGIVYDQPTLLWKLPVDSVPDIDILVLPSDSFDKFKESVS